MRRVLLFAGLALLLVVLGAAFALVPGMRQRSYMGSGYVAKQLCSCVFVSQRELGACRADLSPDSDAVQSQLLPAERAVRAWVPLLAERTARYAEGTGCTLE